MTERFQVSTRASGTRRTLDVYLYDTVEELRAACARETPEQDFGDIGGRFSTPGYIWPNPSRAWFGLIRLHRGQIDADTIAHEATHAALEIYFADCTSWHSRTRTHMRSDNEPAAYLVGELAGRIVEKLHRLHAWG